MPWLVTAGLVIGTAWAIVTVILVVAKAPWWWIAAAVALAGIATAAGLWPLVT